MSLLFVKKYKTKKQKVKHLHNFYLQGGIVYCNAAPNPYCWFFTLTLRHANF